MAIAQVQKQSAPIYLQASQFKEELAAIKDCKLHHEESNNPQCAQILNNLQKLAPRYVDLVIEYSKIHGQTAKERVVAKEIWDLTAKMTELIEAGKKISPHEPIFKNQDPEAENRDLIKAPKIMYIGALLNSTFATFACNESFASYNQWAIRFLTNSQFAGVKMPKISRAHEKKSETA